MPPANASIEVCAAPDVGAFPTGTTQVLWTGNEPFQTLNPTLNTLPTADFASAEPFTVGPGATLSFRGTGIGIGDIDQTSAEAAFAQGDYVDYSFTTAANMPAGRTLNNISRQSLFIDAFNFDMTILVSDDPTFATAHTECAQSQLSLIHI